MSQYDIACVGILCADVLAKPVSELPEKGKLNLIDSIVLDMGGCAANAAIDLSKLGFKPVIVAKIGNDGFGGFIKNKLSSGGVDISGLVTDDGVQTSASVLPISADGERTVMHCLGTNAGFCYEDINLDIINNSKIVFIAGTFLMPSFDGDGAVRLLREAGRMGKIRMLDTAWDSTGRWFTVIEKCLPELDWFMPSYEEAVAMSGLDDEVKIADFFAAKGARNVIIKLGSRGCHVRPADAPAFSVPTYGHVKVVDTSGAGDSFCAGFIGGLLKGWDLPRCACFANAVGSHCVMEMGTTNGVKSFDEIVAFMDRHPNIKENICL